VTSQAGSPPCRCREKRTPGVTPADTVVSETLPRCRGVSPSSLRFWRIPTNGVPPWVPRLSPRPVFFCSAGRYRGSVLTAVSAVLGQGQAMLVHPKSRPDRRPGGLTLSVSSRESGEPPRHPACPSKSEALNPVSKGDPPRCRRVAFPTTVFPWVPAVRGSVAVRGFAGGEQGEWWNERSRVFGSRAAMLSNAPITRTPPVPHTPRVIPAESGGAQDTP